LNTVYTFAGSRKSLSLTFSILSATVSDLLKRQLEIKDIAQIKSLLPGLITFAYIDKDLMRIHEDSLAERDRVNAKGKSRKDRREEVDKAYEKAAAEGGDAERLEEEEDVVLQFQFNDGELKSSNGVGKVITRRKFS
jgi:DEAD/DEAH box helicase domain-containing protein